MFDLLESRERLESAHRKLQDAMTELITKKNYSEAELLLLVVDKLMLDLVEDMGAPLVRPSVWTWFYFSAVSSYVEGEMEKTVEATRIASHGLFYMENAGGTHSTVMQPTLVADEQIADQHRPSCFALEEEKGADWKGLGAARPIINEVKPSL
jgi:hypothetical protein